MRWHLEEGWVLNALLANGISVMEPEAILGDRGISSCSNVVKIIAKMKGSIIICLTIVIRLLRRE